MSADSTIFIGGQNHNPIRLYLPMANRHGFVAGATGTGKTVTLQVLAEGFSRAGVPVFMTDVKGDLSGLAATGKAGDKITRRLEAIGHTGYQARNFPCVFWDIHQQQGHPIRTTISEFGPLLMASILELNGTQTGILYTAFKIADDQGLLLLDLKDLRALINWMEQQRAELKEYGAISSASIGAVQRRLEMLEQQGGDQFFGEPALALQDILKQDLNGNGIINILDASKLILQPRVYSLFLLWLISELFEQLPEVGDADRPKLVFFFDEAHLLFNNAPKALLEKIEQVVRLIRSKGVGLYFISQSPADIPDAILGQLGNRFQHALRAYTPKDQKAVRAAAQSFRPNPAFATEQAITELGVGEALVSVLDPEGKPTIVERTLMAPPESQIGPINSEQREEVLRRSPYLGKYDQTLDRHSAYEALKEKSAQKMAGDSAASATRKPTRARQSVVEAMLKSAARSIGSSLGRQIVRGVLGSILGRK